MIWLNSTVPPTVIADDGVLQAVTVPYPPSIDGRQVFPSCDHRAVIGRAAAEAPANDAPVPREAGFADDLSLGPSLSLRLSPPVAGDRAQVPINGEGG